MSGGEKITQDELRSIFGETIPMGAISLLFGVDGAGPTDLTPDQVRARLRAIAETRRPPQDDSDVVEAAMRVQTSSGRLILRRVVEINGILHQPGIFMLTHVGPAPAY